MGKLKTNKSVQKRFRTSKTKKIMHARAGRRHLLTGKSAKQKRYLRQKAVITSAHEKSIRRLLPYA